MRAPIPKPALAGLAAVILLAGAQPSLARPEATLPSDLHPIVQLAPSQGTVLVAGSSAELRWAELAGFAELREVEEWEAFLSLDGGKTYPVRITPHLDRDVQTVRWEVPSAASSDARLLFRFGREEEGEVGYSPQVSFKIELKAGPTPVRISEAAPEPGEAALPGQAGVVSWMAGSRRGTELRQVEARRPLELNPRPALGAGSPVEPLPYAPEERKTEVRADLAASTALGSWSERPEPAPAADPLVPPIPPLLQTQRQNE